MKDLDIVGIATYEDSFPYQKRIIEIAKQENPARPVVLGGPLVTSIPKVMMQNTLADYAVIGEGELTLIELTDHFIQSSKAIPLSEIKGLTYKNAEGELFINKRRKQMHNLDAVPIQDISLWPNVRKSGEASEIYMSSSRGCPGHCSFCFRTMPALRYKSAARVRRELEYLKTNYNFRFVWWNDLTFIDSRKRIHKLLDDAFFGIDFRWSCFTRADNIDLPILEHMKAMGCDIVMYGFESITKEILEYFRKKVEKSQIVKAIQTTRKANLKVGGLFIIGAPGETSASLNRVIKFCRKFKEVTRVKYMSALPGTYLYYDALKKGIIKDELQHLYFLSRERALEDDEILNFTELKEEELRAAYHEINTKIQVRPYEYWNPANKYLEDPKEFEHRPIIISS
jgi:radical SAM superfamily enzyme YgiQ (UPF0313 family)